MSHPIWTLDARDNVLLDVIAMRIGSGNSGMRRQIRLAHEQMISELEGRGVQYRGLRTALSPQPGRHEVVLLFDTKLVPAGLNYAHEVARQIIPLLHREQRCSILTGDLVSRHQDAVFSILENEVFAHRRVEISNSGQLYGVYINNLTRHTLDSLCAELTSYPPFAGFAHVTFSSRLKDFLSTVLSPVYVKRGVQFICGTDDPFSQVNCNLPGWPLEDFRYTYHSVTQEYCDLFLSYKIERSVRSAFFDDVKFSLNAISDQVIDLEDLEVQIDSSKVDYLRSHKAATVARADERLLDAASLKRIVSEKVLANYVYNLRYDEVRGQSFFNIVLEVGAGALATRLTCALEYRPESGTVRLVTLY